MAESSRDLVYRGKSFTIDCSRGGVVNNPNVIATEPAMMLTTSKNLNLHNGGREKRGGTDHKNTSDTAITGTPEIRGLFQARYEDGDVFIIAGDDNGKVWKDYATEITGASGVMSLTNKFWFEMGDDLLFVCDGENEPRTSIGGANLVDISTSGAVAADWSGSSVYPQYMIVHGRGVSRRMWAFGVPGTASQISKTLYYSESGDLDDFVGGAGETKAGTIIIETADDTGIVGAVEFGDRIIAFSKQKAFLIVDFGLLNTWGYEEAQWDGGVAHQRLIVKTPTDVVCMDEGGNIYSIRATQNYGDYQAASLSRPSWIHKWIQDNVDLSQVANFHAQYDANLRAIKFFVQLTSGTQVDTALVYFIDRGAEEGWMIHDATNADSGYQAASSTTIRDSNNVPFIYTGDYAGYVWQLETANLHDNSNVFDCIMETVYFFMDDPHTNKLFKRFELMTQSRGVANLTVNITIDNASAPGGVITLLASGSALGSPLGSFILGADEEDPEHSGIYIHRKGKQIKIKITNSSIIEDFYLSTLRVDYKPLGHRLD